MTQREQFYRDMINDIADTTVNIGLATRAIFTAHYGIPTPSPKSRDNYKRLSQDLHKRYPKTMTPKEVLAEMDLAKTHPQ